MRPSDLAAWVNQPADALDLHPVFAGMPMLSRVASNGTEIRVYSNRIKTGRCSVNDAGYLGTQMTCTESSTGCDNVFYLRNGKVLEYLPVGQCFTDDRVLPRPPP